MAYTKKVLDILKDNYYNKSKDGKTLLENSPEELNTRIASSIFPNDPEAAYNLYEALMSQEVIFNSPVMFNIGLPTKQILSACWVGDLEDNMDSILEAAKATGIIFKYGSGIGLPLTNLRPKNDIVSNSGYASGPISFMEIFDKYGEIIKSGGKRRAAFISVCRVDHPDILDIINCKRDSIGTLGDQYLENMNISIAVTDEFLHAVSTRGPFTLKFNGTDYKTVDANELFEAIAENAWISGDPGLIFIDQVNRVNPLPGFASIESTNPCGEQPLHPYTSCNLGHINLTALTYKDNDGNWCFNYDKFVDRCYLMTRALDAIIDCMDFPTKKFRQHTLETRPIGLGFTGLAEVLYRLRIPYSNSQQFVRNLTHLMTSSVIEESIELAGMYGTSKTIMNNIEVLANLVLKYTGDSDLYHATLQNGIRNSTWTTLAPTGTTSLAVDSKSYGLEPHFGLMYTKNFISQGKNEVTRQETYLNDEFADAIEHLDLDKDKLIADLKKNKGSCQKLTYIPEEIRRVFEIAHDLTPKQHLQICAAAQSYISSAISKTINIPSEATVDDVKEVYMTAWELGLKGATIYRDGAKQFQPISFSDSTELSIQQFQRLPRGASIVRGDEAEGGTIDAWRTACTKMYVTPGYSKRYKDVLIETFLAKRTGGGCDSNLKAIALLVSLALRKGVPVKDIESELFSITCTHCISAKANGKDINALSCPQAIARTLRKQGEKAANYDYLSKTIIPAATTISPMVSVVDKCAKCGEPTIMASGCVTCPNCGDGGCDHGRD